jgi:hypothetical protein
MSFIPTIEEKLEIDKKEIIRVMLAHSQAKYMVQVLKKGPPKDLGYMWGLNEPDYWTEQEKAAINIMHVWVLQKGWESSGYAIMFRALEKEIKNRNLRFLNSEP